VADDTTSTSGATPDGAPTPDGATPDGHADGQRDADTGTDRDTRLSDGGARALEREREQRRDAVKRAGEADARAADAERRLQELTDAGKSELERAISRLDRQGAELERERSERQRLEAELARRDLLETKRSIAQELGIPLEAAHRLQGEDARSIRADAQRYLDERGSDRQGDIGVGRGGAASGRTGAADFNTLIRQASGRP